jgi:hypothetical protein
MRISISREFYALMDEMAKVMNVQIESVETKNEKQRKFRVTAQFDGKYTFPNGKGETAMNTTFDVSYMFTEKYNEDDDITEILVSSKNEQTCKQRGIDTLDSFHTMQMSFKELDKKKPDWEVPEVNKYFMTRLANERFYSFADLELSPSQVAPVEVKSGTV